MDISPARNSIPRQFFARWRLADCTFAVLTLLAVLAAWEGFVMNNYCKLSTAGPGPAILDAWDRLVMNEGPDPCGCGGDFLQFYIAGTIVNRGEAERLYDQPYFRHFQVAMRDDPLCSLYPPTMALLASPLARMTYHEALTVWWMLQAACLAATGAIFYRHASLSPAWKVNMLVALASLLPLWIAITIGHLAPMLLLVLAGGLILHQQGNRCLAGLVLSLLALKPQLAVGLVIWMLVRRDLRTLAGLTGGFALQALAVAATLGPGRWCGYLQAMPIISAVTRAYRYSPVYEQSFAGIAGNLFWAAGLAAWKVSAMRVAYAVTTGAAAVLLCRVVWARQSWTPAQSLRPLQPAAESENYEYACGVLFMMIFPPYLLVYDQTLLAVPLVMLWSSPAWRWGIALFATTTALVPHVSFALGFSLTGLVALATMFSLARAVDAACPVAGGQQDSCLAGIRKLPRKVFFDFLKKRPRFQVKERLASGK